MNWEDKFREHIEETERQNREREEKIERAEKMEKSWELLRECMAYLKENEKSWKRDEDDRQTERRRKEQQNRAKQKAALWKDKRETQMTITETWKKLPEHE